MTSSRTSNSCYIAFVVQFNSVANAYQVWTLNENADDLVFESAVGQLAQVPTQFAATGGRYYVVAGGTVYSSETAGSAAAISGPSGVSRLLQTTDGDIYAMSTENLWRVSGTTGTTVERAADVREANDLVASGEWVFFTDQPIV